MQTQSPEIAAKMCNKGRLFLNCFKKEEKADAMSLPVSWARFSFLVCWNEPGTTLLMTVELLLRLRFA